MRPRKRGDWQHNGCFSRWLISFLLLMVGLAEANAVERIE